MRSAFSLSQDKMSLWEKLQQLNLGLLFLILITGGIGIAALYSAAGGNMDPWAERQLVRFIFTFFIMTAIALIDISWWQKLAYPAYIGGLLLLMAVEIMGLVGMGAQRWINLGFIQLQPSELMKIAVIMVLAQYFHALPNEKTKKLSSLIFPALLIGLPVALVMMQPDLGTALMILFGGAAMFLMAGVSLWLFVALIVLAVASIPLAWYLLLHDYQKERVLTFLNPERDPLGAGYHITQSKIALGSGGVEGKGFLNGSQSRLNFLPEKQTDFIFTLWAEEWGFLGSIGLLFILFLLMIYGVFIALRSYSAFGRLLAAGLSVNFSLYVMINVAMVMGLIPVVGVPLPLISYGGTAMLAAMVSFGLIMSANIHRNKKLPRFPY